MEDFSDVETSNDPDTISNVLAKLNQTKVEKETKFRVNGYRIDSMANILSQVKRLLSLFWWGLKLQ